MLANKYYCPICEENKSVDLIGAYKHRSKMFCNKQLFKCQDCELIFVHPMPDAAELDWYYKNIWIKDGQSVSLSRETELVYRIQAKERVKYLSRFISLRPDMKILDIGAGFGYLYNAFDKTDIKADSFYATDPSPDNLERLKAKGVNAFSSLAELNQRGFDLVTLCYVLEHINDPYQFMISVMDYVKDGGYVFIDLPERDDTFKPVLEPHVAVYTAESLKHLANKLGFKIIHLTGYGVKRSDLIAQTSAKRNLINRFENVFGRIANKIHRRDDVQKLYKQYKFNEEGEGRWWIRAVLRKK